MRRYAESFFRNPLIPILPFLVLLPAALLYSESTVKTATVAANVWVDQNSVQQIGYSNPYLPPAQNVANSVMQLLQSPSFDVRVAQRSPLYWRNGFGRYIAGGDLAMNVAVYAGGPNLLTFSYKTPNALAGAQIIRSILTEATLEIDRLNHNQNSTQLATAQTQAANAHAHLTAASKALGDYLLTKNISPKDIASQALFDPQLATLYQTTQSAQVSAQSADQQLAQVRTQGTAHTTFQEVDRPFFSIASRKKTAILDGVIALVVSLLLGGGYVVVKTALDRSVRYTDEVPDLVGLPVLGVLPYSRALIKKAETA